MRPHVHKVEFLEAEPRHSQAEVEAKMAKAVESTFIGTELLFENERCRVWDFSMPPRSGLELDWHHHTLDYFFVNTCGGANKPGESEHGLTSWDSQAMQSTTELWSEDRDAMFVSVEDGGFSFDDPSVPVHVDKVWNHRDVPYCSFIVELK